MDVCKFSKIKPFGLEVVGRDSHKCRYHKKGQQYSSWQMVPRGLCPEAFHSIYPFALGLLYYVNKDKFLVNCPKGDAVFEVRREPADFINKFKFHLKKIIAPFYPVDPRKYKILIKVAKVKGKCPKEHKEGQEFEFNQENKNELCPAAFDSIFPYIYANEFSEKVLGNCSFSCPDHLTNVVFRSQNTRESNIDSMACEDINLEVNIKAVEGECPFEFKENQKFKFSDMIPKGICHSLFHNIYPYIFTLEQDGCFKFNGKKNIIVQCPDYKGRVAIEVKRKDNENHLRIVQIKGTCPKRMEDIVLPDILTRPFPFCPKLFDAIFPYANKLEFGNKNNSEVVSCPSCSGNVIVELTNNGKI